MWRNVAWSSGGYPRFVRIIYLRNSVASDMGIFGYIDANYPKERSPDMLQISPKTPSILPIFRTVFENF